MPRPKKASPSHEDSFFHLPHAKWVMGVLALLIAVVGQESLLGLLLRQTRSEIASLIQDRETVSSSPGILPHENN